MNQCSLSKYYFYLLAIVLLSPPLYASDLEDQSTTKKFSDDYKMMLATWKNYLTHFSSAYADKKVDQAKINLAKEETWDFKEEKNLGNKILIAVNYINDLAKGYAKTDTFSYQNDEIKTLIISNLKKITEHYNTQGKEFGNWWQWEIGIPKSLNEIMILLGNDLPVDLAQELINATRHFQPAPTLDGGNPEAAQYSSAKKTRESTGGNRTDTATISLARGLLTNDKDEIQKAITAIYDVGRLKEGLRGNDNDDQNDGFYIDGSFIQHSSVPYSATYGGTLIEGLGLFSYILKNSTIFKFSDSRLDNIYESILTSYNWLFINGGINDSVSGRAIDIKGRNDVIRARGLIANMALFIDSAPQKYKLELQQLLKRVMIEQNYDPRSAPNYTIRGILNNIINDSSIVPLTTLGVKRFPFMDRAVQRSTKGSVVIAMHSNRTAAYESMNGENKQGWHTGDGMTYIYDSSSIDSFTNYWNNVDPYMLPGTTESNAVREDGKGERRKFNERSSKTFVGGVDNGIQLDSSQKRATKAMIAMDFSSYNDKTVAKKSWVLLGDTVLALGSTINSSDEGDIITTIDNRIVNADQILVTEGNIIHFTHPNGQNISYKILDGQIPKTQISTGKDGHTQFAKIWLNHGQKPQNARYAYFIMPGYSVDEANRFDTSQIKILKQNNEQHAVKVNNTLFVNFFNAGEVDGLSVDKPLSIIREEEGTLFKFYIADPTLLLTDKVNLLLRGRYSLQDGEDVSESVSNEGTTFTFSLKQHQKYFTTIKREEDENEENDKLSNNEISSVEDNDNPQPTTPTEENEISSPVTSAEKDEEMKEETQVSTSSDKNGNPLEEKNSNIQSVTSIDKSDEASSSFNVSVHNITQEQLAYLKYYKKIARALGDTDTSILDHIEAKNYFSTHFSESNQEGLGIHIKAGQNQSVSEKIRVGGFAEYRHNTFHQFSFGGMMKAYDFVQFIRYRYLSKQNIKNHYLDLYLGYEKLFTMDKISLYPKIGVLGSYLLPYSSPLFKRANQYYVVQTQLSTKLSYQLNDLSFYIEPMWKINLKKFNNIEWNGQNYSLDQPAQEWIGKIGIAKNIGNYTFDISGKMNNLREKHIIATMNYQF